ncbi:hypothetical protein [Fontimonas thermophila]|uniref:hypothetical protein n=1 Tax=Fontimonas thermophila TaxID=1076937 RepID=UPI000B84FD2F|nr:hypothetical protein [Fontimonas thermophila]
MLAGPVVFAVACLVMAGSALWLPAGPAQIDNLVLPILLFPAIWAALFFCACLARRLTRAWIFIAGIGLLHAALIAQHLLHSAP